MKKNVASQVIGAQMVTAADGTAFTGSVSVSVTVDGGTQGAGGGTGPTHEGNGFHSYAPTQAETNGDHVAFTFTGSGAIPTTVQVYPTFPQTGDNFARLGAPAGASIAADIGTRMPTTHIAATAGKVDGVALVDVTTTNSDMRGTDSALLAASAPANFGDMAITVTTGRVTVGAVGGDAVSGASDLKADVSGLSTHSAADVWAAGTRTLTAGTKDTEVDAIKAKTDQLVFTTANQVDARINSVRGSTSAAEKLERAARSEVLVTCGAGGTTTTVVASSLSPASSVNDQFNGRVLVFAEDTTTAALRGQATLVEDFNHATQTFTVTALTTGPVSGDTAVVV